MHTNSAAPSPQTPIIADPSTRIPSAARSSTQSSLSRSTPHADGSGVICPDGLTRPAWAAQDSMLMEYYDTEWGMPIYDEQGLYERLCLEGFQAGLSWSTILHKRPALRAAFAGFDPDIVAAFNEDDVERLAQDTSIIRNRQKIRAAITNARATVALRKGGGLSKLLWSFRPSHTPTPISEADIPSQSRESRALAHALKQAGFRFIGPTSAFALMEAIGMVDTHLLNSHRRGSSGLWKE